MNKKPVAIFWYRRDLRLNDNAGLYHALKGEWPVLPVFIFDSNILNVLENRSDRRVSFIHHTIAQLKSQFNNLGSDLEVYNGRPEEVWLDILKNHNVKAVYANHDYEPYAKQRDQQISSLLKEKGITLHTSKDQCIFEYNEVLKDNGEPYTVFTPYSRKWKAKLNEFYLKAYPSEKYTANLLPVPSPQTLVTLAQMNFTDDGFTFPTSQSTAGLIKNYDKTRDFPAINGTSRLGIHFRFGTISIREKARKALALNETYLNELIWRDFYMMILAHFPHVAEGAFRKEYNRVNWRNNKEEFEAWCNGKTGYPIVDAGMRELNTTGYMHNRVRMIVASFLTKHLLIDWRWGEAYFAAHLLDFDLSANNGGWQWAAGCGTDAAPYFRVFNPQLQMEKFDKQMVYVKKWVPEYGTASYVKPIVQHEFARKRCLEVYKEALSA